MIGGKLKLEILKKTEFLYEDTFLKPEKPIHGKNSQYLSSQRFKTTFGTKWKKKCRTKGDR